MTPLTIHLLTHNNESTIQQTIDSVAPLDGTVIVADAGSTDRTIKLCRKHGLSVTAFQSKDRSIVRNAMIARSETDWQLWMEPWEVLVSGTLDVVKTVLTDGTAYHLNIVQDDVLTQQVRLWNKKTGLRFVHPVHETLVTDQAGFLNTTIYSAGSSTDKLQSVTEWVQSHPGQNEAYYFYACALLERRRYHEFIPAADEYLFREAKAVRPVTMIRYYKGMVYSYIKQDADAAIRHIVPCLMVNPLMAEFWCLLGDVYYFLLKKYAKAQAFYENGIILGSRRPKNDQWPLQVSKYKEYPEKMIASCKALITGAHGLGVQT